MTNIFYVARITTARRTTVDGVICMFMLFIMIVMAMIETVIVMIVRLEYALNAIEYVQRPFGCSGFC